MVQIPANNATYVPVSGKYSIIVRNSSALANIFSSIATSTGGDYSASSSSSVMVDVVASSFHIPEDTDIADVKVYKVACTKASADAVITWSPTKQDITNSVDLDVDGNEVSVTNFDYGAEW